MFASHHWPRWGNALTAKVAQGDPYQAVPCQTIAE